MAIIKNLMANCCAQIVIIHFSYFFSELIDKVLVTFLDIAHLCTSYDANYILFFTCDAFYIYIDIYHYSIFYLNYIMYYRIRIYNHTKFVLAKFWLYLFLLLYYLSFYYIYYFYIYYLNTYFCR